MTIPQALQQRIRARKDISDEESASDSEEKGTASGTENASEAGLSAVDLEEDTSDGEVRITLIVFDG